MRIKCRQAVTVPAPDWRVCGDLLMSDNVDSGDPSKRVAYRILHPYRPPWPTWDGGLVYHQRFGRNGPRRDDDINHIHAESGDCIESVLHLGTGRGGLPTTEDKVGNQKNASTKYSPVADHCEALNRGLGIKLKPYSKALIITPCLITQPCYLHQICLG